MALTKGKSWGERGGAVNWVGLRTLYEKEVRRFLKVSVQTVLAPAVQTLLFMAVLSVAFGAARSAVLGVEFPSFVGPGLVMMTVLNAGFANTSSSLIVAKLQGNAVDFMMPPLSPAELAAAFLAGGVTRGLLVALAGILVIAPFADVRVTNIMAVIYFATVASLLMSAIGLIAGIWAEKFDHLAAVTSFIITPLSFLSGTFYSVDQLPQGARPLVEWNPVFFAIDGFRYGFIGVSDGDLAVSAVVLGLLTAVLTVMCWMLLRTGWRLKP